MKLATNTLLAVVIACCCFGAVALPAQVFINEYSAANWNQFADNYGKHEDWVELYNAGAQEVNIGNWYLSDDEDETKKWQFPANVLLPANAYLVVWCSKRNESINGNFHTNFSLTQTKGNDHIFLSNAGGLIVDDIVVQKTDVKQSRCRSIDGGPTWVIAKTPTLNGSNNNAPQYERYAAAPVADIKAGFYDGAQTVTLSTTEPNGVIRYTLNGNEPKNTSAIYSGPITISNTKVLKARTYTTEAGILPSFTEFNTYFINDSFSLPVMSVAADGLLSLAGGTQSSLRPVGSIEYFDPNKVRKATSFGELNRHGQDSWVNDQRSLDWVSRDEMGYSNAIREKLFNYSGRDEYQRVILRASGDDNYPGNFLPSHEGCAHIRDEYSQALAKLGGLKLDVRASERIIVFLNGQYWGVYGLREYPDDHDYTEYTYNQDKYDIQVLETWDNTWAEYGGDKAFEDWRVLEHFILDNDMSDPANYEQVKDQLNITSLCDYFICGLNFVASDWINYNTGWWRGTNPNGDHKKWGYMLWDFDATFDYYINYSHVPNTAANAQPCDIDLISDGIQNEFYAGFMSDTCYWTPWEQAVVCYEENGKHDLIFRKLQAENPEFREYYYARKADLDNTVFSCANMLHVLDSMVAVIDPEMSRHAQRWGGTYTNWRENVQRLRDYISERCTLLDEGMVDCFDLEGPYPVTLMVQPAGAGEIEFNTLDHQQLPWTGSYFGNMSNRIEANAKTAAPFIRWETRTGAAVVANPNADISSLQISGPDTLVAVFAGTSSVWETANGIKLSAEPTLATTQVRLQYELPEAMSVQVRVVNTLGQTVWQSGTLAPAVGAQQLNIDTNNLTPGFYVVEFQAGQQRKAVKITKMTP